MASGKIKFFNRKKGFGFIVEDESQSDVFFHATNLINKKIKFRPKDLVKFEIREEEGKKKAYNIDKVEITSETEIA